MQNFALKILVYLLLEAQLSKSNMAIMLPLFRGETESNGLDPYSADHTKPSNDWQKFHILFTFDIMLQAKYKEKFWE